MLTIIIIISGSNDAVNLLCSYETTSFPVTALHALTHIDLHHSKSWTMNPKSILSFHGSGIRFVYVTQQFNGHGNLTMTVPTHFPPKHMRAAHRTCWSLWLAPAPSTASHTYTMFETRIGCIVVSTSHSLQANAM
jgi:hypothetical protein